MRIGATTMTGMSHCFMLTKEDVDEVASAAERALREAEARAADELEDAEVDDGREEKVLEGELDDDGMTAASEGVKVEGGGVESAVGSAVVRGAMLLLVDVAAASLVVVVSSPSSSAVVVASAAQAAVLVSTASSVVESSTAVASESQLSGV